MKRAIRMLLTFLAALTSIGWTDIREDCVLFGYARTDRFRGYAPECAALGDNSGQLDRLTVWFNCRRSNQSVVGRGYRWAKCLNGEEHFSGGSAYQADSFSCLLTDGACLIRAGGLADAQLRVGSETPEGLILRALLARAQSVRDEVTNQGGESLEDRLLLVTTAELFAELADAGFALGDVAEAAQSVSVARRLLDVAADFTPGVSFVKDAAVLVTGVNPITGEAVSDAERALTLATLVAPSFLSGGAKALVKVGDHLADVAQSASPVAHVADDIVQAISRADADLLDDVPSLPCTPGLSSSNGRSPFAATAAATPCKLGEITAAFAEAAASNLDFLRRGNTGFGTSVRTDYAKTFRQHYPQYADAVGQVHHAVPQRVLDDYPGLVSVNEMHSLENLRGIPKGATGTRLHQGEVTPLWDNYIEGLLQQGRTPSRDELLDFARQIDDEFGKRFVPRVR